MPVMHHYETSAATLLPHELASLPDVSASSHADILFRAAHNRLSPQLRHEFRKILARHRGLLQRCKTRVVNTFADREGNLKLKLRLSDGAAIETVVLVDRKPGGFGVRKTLCVSSQVGCKMGCTFCKTGQLGFRRNLSTAEIVEQLVAVRERFGDVSNIVFMGMGEPLLNAENVFAAIRIFAHPHGPSVALKRITVSTCGIPSAIKRLASQQFVESQPTARPRLAVSLVSAHEELRAELMPGATSIAASGFDAEAETPALSHASKGFLALEKALRHYLEETGRNLTFEFPLFRGINDTEVESSALCAFLDRLPRRERVDVNLIPWNPVEDIPFSSPAPQAIHNFAKKLTEAGYAVTGRYPRGRSIGAACGQLGEISAR